MRPTEHELRILVTGATGYIGRHVVTALAASGARVIKVSRTARRGDDDPATETIEGDLLDPNCALQHIVEQARASTLVHLAWVTEHGQFWDAPQNITWLARSSEFADCFVRQGGLRMVVVGSCAEYIPGAGALGPQPLPPAHLYGATKHALRLRLASLAAKGNCNLAWARVFMPIGPGEDHRRLMPYIICTQLRGEPALCTSGRQIRDLMDVRDCGRALAQLALSTVTGALDIGSGMPISIGDFATAIAVRMGRPDLLRLAAVPERSGEPERLVADTRRLTQEVGFRPTFSLGESIDAAMAYWRSRHTEARSQAAAL